VQGIYKITNINNNKVYIGKSKDIDKRISQHKSDLTFNNHDNYKLQIDYNKYGKDSFKYETLEEVQNYNKLSERERYYINLYDSINTGYNINKVNPKIDDKEVLSELYNSYFRNSKNYIIKFQLPYFSKDDNDIKKSIKIFQALIELQSVIDVFYYKRMYKKILEKSFKVKIENNNKYPITSIMINISYTLKEDNWRQTIIFSIGDIYKTMDSKNINIQDAIVKLINNKKNLRNF
jgi:group I intron endonuclease